MDKMFEKTMWAIFKLVPHGEKVNLATKYYQRHRRYMPSAYHYNTIKVQFGCIVFATHG